MAHREVDYLRYYGFVNQYFSGGSMADYCVKTWPKAMSCRGWAMPIRRVGATVAAPEGGFLLLRQNEAN